MPAVVGTLVLRGANGPHDDMGDKSTAGDAELEVPECPICFEMYEAPPSERAPAILPCGHYVYQQDAAKLLRQGDPTVVICPTCRHSSTHASDPPHFPCNYSLVAACEVIRAQQQLLQDDGGVSVGGGGGAEGTTKKHHQLSTSVHECCDESTAAAHFCALCGEFLCPKCLDVHS